MDAATHADRKGNEKDEKKRQGRDDVKERGAEGRYEGGNDSDQPRQAQGRKDRDEDKPATSEPQSTDKGRRGTEEE